MQISGLPKADHPLTDAEIVSTYGPLMEEAISAFRRDPGYVVDIVETAAVNLKRRHEFFDEHAEIIRELTLSGLGMTEISQRLGVRKEPVQMVQIRLVREGQLPAPTKSRPKPPRTHSDDLPNEITRLRLKGLSVDEIARLTNYSPAGVRRLGKKADKPITKRRPNPVLTPEEREQRNIEISELVESGQTKSAVARHFGISQTAVNKILKARADTSVCQ